jgi:two-component system NtrC family sensor kinase
MVKILKNKIFYKLLFLILPLAILSIITTATLICWTNYVYFRKTIRQNYGNIITTSASEIHHYLQNARRDLESLAWILRVSDLDERRTELSLTAFQYAKPKFATLTLINAENFHGPPDTTQTAYKGEAARVIEMAFGGVSAVSSVVFTDASLPMVHLAAPVIRSGKIDNVLFGSLNLKSIWNVLEGIKIGHSGQVSILDFKGQFIGRREMNHVVLMPPVEKPNVLKAIKTATEPVEWMEQKDGATYFCIGAYVPDQEWAVILSQSAPEIYGYLYTDMGLAALLSALICSAAALLSWRCVKRFTRPIQALHRQVLQIGAGDLEQQVTVASADEIGELGAAFNEMTISLKDLVQREIRTAQELAHARNLAVLGITAGKVTHEVGNLLNNVGMSAHALRAETLSPQGQVALANMEKESARVKAFIQDFLKFAKPPELQLAPVSLDLVIREAMAMHEAAAARQGIALELSWPADAPRVNADTRLIYQVFNNLIKNSIEAIQGSGKITVKGELENGHLVIAVEDNGSGIAPDHIERVFEPFFTTKGQQGTGLGLAIVKSIITSHRGTITGAGEPGRGTRFAMRLPLK